MLIRISFCNIRFLHFLTVFLFTGYSLTALAETSSASVNKDKVTKDIASPNQKSLSPILTTEISDGPYVFREQNQLEAYWVCKGVMVKKILKPQSTPISIEQCQLPAKVRDTMIAETKILNYQGDFTVAALSDFHGQYDLMIELLTNNRIIDENKKWLFGNGHFVITGDIFDRGDKVTEILWFLYNLEQQAEKAGGKIHLTLGNHEVMILNGDLRYLYDKYPTVASLLKKPFQELFSKKSVLGNWLRSKPVLVKVNELLFAHGGFHPKLAEKKVTLETINEVFKANLVKAELNQPREGFAKFLHKSHGPIWYRGYFSQDKNKDNGASSAEIDLLLKHFKVKHLIVGHTSQKQIETRYQGRVIAIDSSIKRGKYGEILFIKKEDSGTSKMWRGSLSGEVLPLQN